MKTSTDKQTDPLAGPVWLFHFLVNPYYNPSFNGDFGMFTLALEAMQATAQSKFGRELDALWQSVIDYRDKELQQLDYRVRYKKNSSTRISPRSSWISPGNILDFGFLNVGMSSCGTVVSARG